MLGMLAASGGRSPVFAQTPFDENGEEYVYTGGLRMLREKAASLGDQNSEFTQNRVRRTETFA